LYRLRPGPNRFRGIGITGREGQRHSQRNLFWQGDIQGGIDINIEGSSVYS
jgi:hypothetical protein